MNSPSSAPLAIVFRLVESLVPYARNPRKNDQAVDRMISSIREFGFKVPILAKSDGTVIDGHLRLKAAIQLGMADVPVIECDAWTDAQVKAFRLMANKSVAWAEWDEDLLALEIAELADFNFDLKLTGFDDDEIRSLLSSATAADGLTDDDATPELPEEPVTRLGDLWVLGRHRLLCGDSTNLPDLQRVTAGQPVDLVFTDPPYNVAYSGRGEVNPLGPIENDSMSDLDFDSFISRVFSSCAAVMRPLAPIYVAHPDSRSTTKISFETQFARHFHKAATIIWLKQSAGMGWQDYRAQHEPLLYGWKAGAGSHYFVDDRSKTTVWEIGRDAQMTYVHPTQKPVALAEEAIRNSSKPGDRILDLFGGSGSTLIASEKTGRDSFLVELDPKYCDVIIRRWQEFTGKACSLEHDGATFDAVTVQRKGGA